MRAFVCVNLKAALKVLSDTVLFRYSKEVCIDFVDGSLKFLRVKGRGLG